jgi:hypothetical protein
MAHFARVEDNIVREVIVVNNEVLKDANGIEQEALGAQFCADTFGGEWKQTSYNGNFRGTYAGVGMTYNSNKDIFEYPKIVTE